MQVTAPVRRADERVGDCSDKQGDIVPFAAVSFSATPNKLTIDDVVSAGVAGGGLGWRRSSPISGPYSGGRRFAFFVLRRWRRRHILYLVKYQPPEDRTTTDILRLH